MHIKRALSQDVSLELVHPGERIKTAGAMPEVQAVLDALQPEPAYTYALVNAMGYSEYYGTNSNADWYGYCPEVDYNGLLHTWPDIGQNVETDKLLGKDWPYGYPCFYNAAVYAHHKNTDPVTLGFGDVQFAYANHDMKRIELLMRIHNEEARKKGHLNIVDRIHAGERCDVSMGAKIPWDACSYCTDWDAVEEARSKFDPKRHKHWGLAVLEQHKLRPIRGIAVTSAEYCVHLKTQKNKVLPDGRKIFMYNVFPRFFDISCVFIGADRTARVMWHLAPSFRDAGPIPQPMRSAQQTLLAGLRPTAKVAEKRAELEKEIPGVVMKVFGDSDTAPEGGFERLGRDPEAILTNAAALGIILTPEEFGKILGADGGFSTNASKIDDSLAVRHKYVDDGLLSAMKHLAPERSGYRPFVEPRITRISVRIIGPACRNAPENGELAALYNGYRLSVLERAQELADRARAHLSEGTELGPGRESSLASLLLGVAPMVHLLAAHLRRDSDEGQRLGAMASLLANNSSFASLASLGSALRIGMIAEPKGMLPTAIRLIAGATKDGPGSGEVAQSR